MSEKKVDVRNLKTNTLSPLNASTTKITTSNDTSKIEAEQDIYEQMGPYHKDLLALASQVHTIVMNKPQISLTNLCKCLQKEDTFEVLNDSRTLLMEFLTTHFSESFEFVHCNFLNLLSLYRDYSVIARF